MFFFAGLPGIALALLFVLTVREPTRGAAERQGHVLAERAGLGETLAFLLRSRAYLAMVMGATFMGLNVFAAGVWIPSFLERVHGLNIAEIASIVGPARGIFGVAGVLLGGLAIDRSAGARRIGA